MRYFVGIDLHSDSNYTGVIDKKDSRIFGKKLPNDLGVILKELEPFKKEIQGIVVESTYNWYWLVDGLQEAKYKVHLANPAAMQQYSGMKYTDDKWDSYWLAHMLRLGILPEGYIYPKEIRPVRDLLRKRTMLVRHRTAHILSLQNMMNRNTGRKLKVNDAKKLSEEEISKQLSDEHLIMAVQSDKAVIDFFNEQTDRIEKVVLKEVKLRYPYKELVTVPEWHKWGQWHKWDHTLISDYIIANKRQFCTLSVMTRQRHIEFEVAYYHVLSRGNERRDIFTDNDDRISFLEI